MSSFLKTYLVYIQQNENESKMSKSIFHVMTSRNIRNIQSRKIAFKSHTGAKPTFYPEIPLILIIRKCEFFVKWDIRNVNFVKIEISEKWIL